MNLQAPPKEGRYVFVDGLRGLAAVLVMLHHLLHCTVLEITLRKILPLLFQHLCYFGSLGVQIFFVISGFVIVHALRNIPMTAKQAGIFVLRRQLRLDPPYWCAIAFSLFVAFIEVLLPNLQSPPMPSVPTVMANGLYVYRIVGVPEILGVAWTLCLEVQFYLALIVLLMLGRIWKGRCQFAISSVSMWLVFVSGLVSLAFAPYQGDYKTWMLPYWAYFAGGALCKWCLEGRVRRVWLFLFCGFFLAAAVWSGRRELYSGLLTLVLLYSAGRMGGLCHWLSHRPLQYLGRISYSLYLVHLPILLVILRAGFKITGEHAWASVGWFVLAAGCSVAAADVFYRLIERPSMRWAGQLRKSTITEEPNILVAGRPLDVPSI